jgi:pyruvate,water dikinase
MQDYPCLTEDQIENLARLGCGWKSFRRPQDVEWTLDHHDRIHVVQCRPLHMEQAILDWSDLLSLA